MSSLRKLAKHLDLSHVTVSAALRGLPGVKADTRERVLRAAAQFGYHINPLASALMASMRRAKQNAFRGVLVLLRPEAPRGLCDHEERTRRRIAQGAARRARELGFDLQEMQVGGSGHEPDKLHDILIARGVRGAVMLAPPEGGEAWRRIDRDLIPCVCAGRRMAGLDYVGPDHGEAMTLALRRVRADGRGRVGLALAREENLERNKAWIAAFYAGQLSAGAIAPSVAAPSFLLYEKTGEGAFHRWLESGLHDALIADAELPLSWQLASRALLPGSDQVCFLDTHAPCDRGAGIDLRWEEIGLRSVDLLADRVLSRRTGCGVEPAATLCRPNWFGLAETARLVA